MGLQIGFVLVSFVFLLFFSAGIYNFLTDFEVNRCNMTYMYDYPQLIRISLPSNVTATYKKYGLYVYAEGRFIEKAREMKFSGIPVLFIPGNRGSPKQVRSLASVSLRKSLAGRVPFHFDFFAVDLNEDYNGLYGGFLEEQTKFVKFCISKIMSLYREDNTPDSIILIGHSMGGMIAKGLFLESGFNPNFVKLIITLATPHSPALLTDSLIAQYYDNVNKYWDTNHHLKKKLNLISIGGGPRDILVRSNLTVTDHADLSVLTSTIPDVWLSVDHLCILWCKELVIVISRALFDSVDARARQITNDVELRKEIFRYHFLDRSGTKRFHHAKYPAEVPLWTGPNSRSSGVWIPMEGNHKTWIGNKVMQVTHITISLATPSDTLAIFTENHRTRDWIFSCVVDTSITTMRVCKTGKNLSGQARISPTKGVKKKSALIDLSKLRMTGYTHVVIRTLPSNEEIKVSLDLFKKRSRTIEGPPLYLFGQEVLAQNEIGSLYYAIEMLGVQKLWNTYQAIIESSNCSQPALAEVTVNVPWNQEGTKHIISGSKGVVPVLIHSPKPQGKNAPNVKVELFLDPQCSYSLRLERTFVPALGAIISRFGITTYSYVAVCLILTLAYQIRTMGENSKCPLLHFAMPKAAKPYVIMQASAITSALGQHLSTYLPFIPPIDTRNSSGFMEMLVIPVSLYLAAFALVYIIGLGMIVGIVFQGQAYNGIILKFLNKFFFGLAWLSEYALSGAIKVPLVVSAFMITVAYSACGGLAVCIGLCFYFFKMVSLYEDFWEEIVYWPLRALKAKLKKRKDKSVQIPKFQIPPIDDFSFHLTLMMLWIMVALINIPTVLVWAKNYRYNTKLEPDPGFINCLILTVCAAVLWSADVPKLKLAGSRFLSYMIFGSAVMVMAFGQTSWYRLSAIITSVFTLVTLHQLIAPWFTKEQDENESPPQLVKAGEEEGSELKSQLAEIFQGTNLEDTDHTVDLGGILGAPSSSEPGLQDEKTVASKDETDTSKLTDEKDVKEKDGEITPSSDASTSSFEQISEKEIS